MTNREKLSVNEGDTAYSTGKKRWKLKKRGCTLESPLCGQENKTKMYPKRIVL